MVERLADEWIATSSPMFATAWPGFRKVYRDQPLMTFFTVLPASGWTRNFRLGYIELPCVSFNNNTITSQALYVRVITIFAHFDTSGISLTAKQPIPLLALSLVLDLIIVILFCSELPTRTSALFSVSRIHLHGSFAALHTAHQRRPSDAHYTVCPSSSVSTAKWRR